MIPVTRPRIFGTGLIALDLVIGADPETPVRCWAGGTCGNVLSILAWLGWDAYPVARMDGDAASERVRADMARWGVHFDWTACAPTTATPIIVQEIRRGRDGRPRHRFSWSCPRCGEWLPPFRAITVNAVERIKPALAGASVFFLDRLSRANLTLAAEASAHGAVVVFEPSGKATDKLMSEGLALAHVVKYADDRLAGVHGAMEDGSAALLEVRTLGERGLDYRHRLGRGVSDWMHLKAVSAPRLADACGSGDWCTAGFIAKAAVGGQKGLRRAGLAAFGRHYGTGRRSQRGTAASRARGAACTPLPVTHSRLGLRISRTADSTRSTKNPTEAVRHRLWPVRPARRSEGRSARRDRHRLGRL